VRYDRPGTGLSDRDVPPRTQAAEVQLLAMLPMHSAPPALAYSRCMRGPVALTYTAIAPGASPPAVSLRLVCERVDIATPTARCPCQSCAGTTGPRVRRAHGAVPARRISSQESESFSRNQRDWANALQAAQLLRLSCEMHAADVLSRVRTVALAIHRRNDRAIPLEAAHGLRRSWPQARLVTVDGNIHLPWIDGDALPTWCMHSCWQREARGRIVVGVRLRLDEANRELVLNGRGSDHGAWNTVSCMR